MARSSHLLDAHAFWWWQASDPRFPGRLRRDVADPDNSVFVSAGLIPLAVTFTHAQRTGSLPYFHKGPFDRLLIAQAFIEGLTLISRDMIFDQYGAKRVW